MRNLQGINMHSERQNDITLYGCYETDFKARYCKHKQSFKILSKGTPERAIKACSALQE